MFIKASIVFLLSVQVAQVVQAKKWLAKIKAGHQCDNVYRRQLLNENNYKVFEYQDGDCLIEFESDEYSKVLMDHMNDIETIEPDQEMFANYLWDLDRMDQKNLPLDKSNFAPSHDGTGISVYIIDTGIWNNHDDFAGRDLRLGADYINEGYPEDGNGHGTHCASKAAGSTLGIARNASIIGVKVLSSSGSGSTSGVISGVKWAVADAAGKPAILSMSLGGGKSTLMNQAVQKATENSNIIVVVAAGNENADALNYSPASAVGSNIIVVGASDSSDKKSSFSNYGSRVDIFAPGSNIMGAYLDNRVVSLSGTSMATPLVAGVLATLMDKHNGDRQNAIEELYALASGNVLTSLPSGTKNLLVQFPTYTGPPTPPTVSPTVPPTNAPPTICIGTKCIDFVESQFNPKPFQPVYGNVFKVGDTVCQTKPSFSEMNNKIVLIPRGECLFFTKVQIAESFGAKAVLIVQNKGEDLFEPAYYGDETVTIPSAMILESDTRTIEQYSLMEWKSQDQTFAPTTASPTVSPTTPKPSAAPTMVDCRRLKRRKCNLESRCQWEKRTCVEFDPYATLAPSISPTSRPTVSPTPFDECRSLKRKECRSNQNCRFRNRVCFKYY